MVIVKFLLRFTRTKAIVLIVFKTFCHIFHKTTINQIMLKFIFDSSSWHCTSKIRSNEYIQHVNICRTCVLCIYFHVNMSTRHYNCNHKPVINTSDFLQTAFLSVFFSRFSVNWYTMNFIMPRFIFLKYRLLNNSWVFKFVDLLCMRVCTM